MPRKYRLIFLIIFTTFFVAASSAITIYSLGYNIDFEEKTLNNTINIQFHTKPRGADVYHNGKKVITTPDDFPAPDNKTINLQVRKDRFMDENFTVWSEAKKNGIATFDDLFLLPTENRTIEKSEDANIITILSDKYILVQDQEQNTFIQLYGLAGIEGEKEIVTIDGGNTIINNGRWDIVYNNIFWNKDQGLLLYKNDGWKIMNIATKITNEIRTIAKGSDNNIIFLDNDNNLWVFDITSEEPIANFVDSNINGLHYTNIPDSVWIWKSDKIYKFNRNDLGEDMAMINFNDYEHFKHKEIEPILLNNDYHGEVFIAKPVHQGTMFKLKNKLIYVPDYNKTTLQIISQDTAIVTSQGETLYWMDSAKQIFSHNLDLQDRDMLMKLSIEDNFEDIILSYSNSWSRIMIYTNTETLSMWHNKGSVNDTIIKYSLNKWIENAECKVGIYENSQICLRDNSLILYQNKSLF